MSQNPRIPELTSTLEPPMSFGNFVFELSQWPPCQVTVFSVFFHFKSMEVIGLQIQYPLLYQCIYHTLDSPDEERAIENVQLLKVLKLGKKEDRNPDSPARI